MNKVLSEDSSIDNIMHGCNTQSRRSIGRKLPINFDEEEEEEAKPVALAIYERMVELILEWESNGDIQKDINSVYSFFFFFWLSRNSWSVMWFKCLLRQKLFGKSVSIFH